MAHLCTSCERRFADGSKEMLSGCPDCGGNTFQYLPEDGSGPTGDPPDPPTTDSTVAESLGRAVTTVRDAVTPDPADVLPRDSPALDEPPEERSNVDAPPDVRTNADAPADEQFGTDAEVIDDDAPEDLAQSSARTDVVSGEDLPDAPVALGRSGPGDPDGDTSDGIPAGNEEQGPSAGGPSGSAGTDEGPPGTAAPAGSSGRAVSEPEESTPDLAELRRELNEQFEGIRILEPGQYELNLMELYEREETIIALRENGRYVIEAPESWQGDG